MTFLPNSLKLLTFFSFLLIISLLQWGCLENKGGGELGGPVAEGPVNAGTPERPAVIEAMPPVGYKLACSAEKSLEAGQRCDDVVCSKAQNQDPQYKCDHVECSTQEALISTEGCNWVTWQGGSLDEWVTFQHFKPLSNSMCNDSPHAGNTGNAYIRFFKFEPCCLEINGKPFWGECPVPPAFTLIPDTGLQDWLADLNDSPEKSCPLKPNGDKEQKLFEPTQKWACCNDDTGQTGWSLCALQPVTLSPTTTTQMPEVKFANYLALLNEYSGDTCNTDPNGQNARSYYDPQGKWACCDDSGGHAFWKICTE